VTSDARPNSADESFAALTSEAVAALSAMSAGEPARVQIPVRLPPSWSQGRATFGGLQAGLALAALARWIDADASGRSLRSMQVEFVAPISGLATLELERLRAGRSATMVRAALRDGDAIAMTLGACFGAARDSDIRIAGQPAPKLDGPEGLVGLPAIEGVTPGFVRFVEMRWAQGGPPGSGLDELDACAGWVRTREPWAVPSYVYLPALIDAWPVPALQHLRQLAPASSVSWSIDFVGLDGLDADAGSGDWWIHAAETDGGRDGWLHTRAKLWTRAGQLVATSRQTVAIYR